eukprot:TRINITY_DN271_c0_g1_i2.p1 TRINITY_DN271_c0_g1~~TRINITY_DN271_c0_g1_i2.p1  ORF type:complete len:497 (-),score=131.35 TRINITY_DN271_c0_g1_i2:314-1804(-)
MAAQQLQVGIELAQKAILLDTNHQYREAIPEYNSAITFFSEVLQDPNCSEQKKSIVSQKIQEYHARVLLLLEAIGETPESSDVQKQADNQPSQQPQAQQTQPQPQSQPQQSLPQQPTHDQTQQPHPQQSFQQPQQPHPQQSFQQTPFQTQQSFQQPAQQQYYDPNSRSIPYGQPTTNYVPPQQPQQPQQTILAYLPSPTGLLPITADLALQYMLDPLLIEYATKHPKNVPNLQASLTLAEKAKEADVKQNYQQAVDLYTDVLERFRVAAAVEQNPAIQSTLLTTMSAYHERVEKIKAMFQLQPRTLIGLPSQTVSPPAMSSHVSAPVRSDTVSNLPQPPQLIKNANGEITESSTNGGPITVKKSTKKLAGLRAGTIALEATVKTNIVKAGDQVNISLFVDNRSSSIVNCMKVKFVRVSGKIGKDSRKMILSRQEYYQGSIFPLQAENSYRGDVIFPIPKDQQLLIPHTPCSFYFVVEADLPMTKNLKVKVPLILTQ